MTFLNDATGKILIQGGMLLLSLAVAVGRFLVPGHGLSLPGTYEAFAHVWVGVLIAVSICRWQHDEGKPALWLLALLTALEVAAFMMRGQ